MPSALQLIVKVMIDELFGTPAPLSGFERAGQFIFSLSIAFLIVGLVLLIYGAYSWLSIQYSDDIAAGITGLISLALSVILVSVLFAVNRYHQIRMRKVRERITDKIKSSLSTLENELSDPIRENPKTALIVASLLGFLVEDKFFE